LLLGDEHADADDADDGASTFDGVPPFLFLCAFVCFVYEREREVC
jgi:hypothetical protein